MQDEQYEGALGGEVSRRVMITRLTLGLAQGVVLYLLYRAASDGAWPATVPWLFFPLFMLALLLPVVVNLSLGHMTSRQATLWAAAAGALLVALALHEAWRNGAGAPVYRGFLGQPSRHLPSMMLIVFSAIFLYIAHALVAAGTLERRRIASYGSYFESAWKLAVQLLFSAFFVLTLFGVLWLGAGLFSLVKLELLRELLEQSWFVVPVICFGFACALHITDVRPAIVRGIRTLLLVLKSWTLPLAVILIAAFLCALPFTGLDALWRTRRATSLLLTAIIVLVVLINAAFQNGQAAAQLVVRIAARTGAILLLPLTVLAAYALGLRVHDYGWTADRIVAAACLLVAACYAIGYMWAAHRYATWLVEIAPVNVGTSFVMLAVLFALFTPIADPARLSVNSQLARLESGAVKAEEFDYRYLRFEGKRYGQQALQRLAAQGVGPQAAVVSAQAAIALKLTERWKPAADAMAGLRVSDNVTVWPETARLPESFVSQQWVAMSSDLLPQCLRRANAKCDAVLLDADGDGRQEVLVFEQGYRGGYLYGLGASGAWELVANVPHIRCTSALDEIRAGRYKLAAPRLKEIEINGIRLHLDPVAQSEDCAAFKPAR